MKSRLRLRRMVGVILMIVMLSLTVVNNEDFVETKWASDTAEVKSPENKQPVASSALMALEELEVKGRAPKTGYDRKQFGGEWGSELGCDMRNIILRRDLTNITLDEKCRVLSGTLKDPYTAKVIKFVRGEITSQAVQIDHVVAASNAWQTGAQQLSYAERVQLYNDPLELLAVDGPANNQKSDGDAATWLPPNKPFRCQYVARQIAVKKKYRLWVTLPEKSAMQNILDNCPGQTLPVNKLPDQAP